MASGGREDVFIQRTDLPHAIAAVKLGAMLIVDRRLTDEQCEDARSLSDGRDFRVVLSAEIAAAQTGEKY